VKQDSVITVLLVVAALVFAALYAANRLSINVLIYVEVTLVLAVSALLLPTGVNRSKNKEIPTFRMPFSLWLLPIVVYTVSQVEILLLRRTGLGYVVALAVALTVIAFAREEPMKKVMVATAIVGVSIVILYSIYTPSFGNDTWRDIIWATQISQLGHIAAATIKQGAYPFPMVPLTYAMLSVTSGMNATWASVVLGLIYLVQLPLLIYLLSRRFTGISSPQASLLLLIAPLAVIWSVWYIPEVYSLSLFLTAFLLQSTPVTLVPLLAAGVFGHGGVATWMVIIMVVLWVTTRKKSVANLLLYLLVIFVAYAIYTTLLFNLTGAYNSVLNAVLAFLRGARILSATVPVPSPPTSSLGNLALSTLAVLGLFVFLRGKGAARALAFFSEMFLVVAYIGASVFPAADLPRYLGLPSAAVLAILAPYAFKVLAEKRGGRIFSSLLLVVTIIAFAYSGLFAPGNPYTANPYSYSVSGLISYDDALQLIAISHILGPGLYLTDWRSGLFLAYKYLWIIPRYQGFEYNNVNFLEAGSYGLFINSMYLRNFRGLVLLRQGAMEMPGVYEPGIFSHVLTYNGDILFNGNNGSILIWAQPLS
jgi:hypothetical protein